MIDSKNPPTFEDDDRFSRKPLAENLLKILREDHGVSPILLDGSWGTGKTTFVNRLEGLAEQDTEGKTLNFIYIDAFSADHCGEPLLPIIAALMSAIPARENEIISAAIPVLRFGLKVASRGLIAHALRQDTSDLGAELEDVLKQASGAAVDATIGNLLNSHKQAESSVQALKNLVAELAGDAKLVLIIDELDRCRPDFAIDMLETVKHTFEIPSVNVLLVANSTQLCAAIKHRYGFGIRGEKYLEKFFALQISLPVYIPGPSSAAGRENHVSCEHFTQLIQESNLLAGTSLVDAWSISVLRPIVESNRVSPREVEKVVGRLAMMQAFHALFDYSARNHEYCYLALVAVLLATLDPALGSTITTGDFDMSGLSKFLGVGSILTSSPESSPHENEILMYELWKVKKGFTYFEEMDVANITNLENNSRELFKGMTFNSDKVAPRLARFIDLSNFLRN